MRAAEAAALRRLAVARFVRCYGASAVLTQVALLARKKSSMLESINTRNDAI